MIPHNFKGPSKSWVLFYCGERGILALASDSVVGEPWGSHPHAHLKNKSKPLGLLFFCGERGIRTPDTLLRYTRFPGEPVQPLLHLSVMIESDAKVENKWKKQNEYIRRYYYIILLIVMRKCVIEDQKIKPSSDNRDMSELYLLVIMNKVDDIFLVDGKDMT